MTTFGKFKIDTSTEADAVEEEDKVFFLLRKSALDTGTETSLFKNEC